MHRLVRWTMQRDASALCAMFTDGGHERNSFQIRYVQYFLRCRMDVPRCWLYRAGYNETAEASDRYSLPAKVYRGGTEERPKPLPAGPLPCRFWKSSRCIYRLQVTCSGVKSANLEIIAFMHQPGYFKPLRRRHQPISSFCQVFDFNA